MTNTETETKFPLTCQGRTLFRMIFKIARRFRVCEQWHESMADAAQAAREICADWAEGRKHAVLLTYPVPGHYVSGSGFAVGGP